MSDRPKEGLYLDAALAVVGEQIEERIDQASRRRRARQRWGVATLALATMVSGSVAAVALSGVVTDAATAPPSALTVSAEVRCVDGFDLDRPAYFTAHYRTTDPAEVDLGRVCTAVRSMLTDDERDIASTPPAVLIRVAEDVLRGAAHAGDPAGSGESAPIAVSEASFGVLSPGGGSQMVVCALDDVTVVLATSLAEPPSLLTLTALCSGGDR